MLLIYNFLSISVSLSVCLSVCLSLSLSLSHTHTRSLSLFMLRLLCFCSLFSFFSNSAIGRRALSRDENGMSPYPASPNAPRHRGATGLPGSRGHEPTSTVLCLAAANESGKGEVEKERVPIRPFLGGVRADRQAVVYGICCLDLPSLHLFGFIRPNCRISFAIAASCKLRHRQQTALHLFYQ